MSDNYCDCVGPNSRINGECAVMVGARHRAEVQRRWGAVADLLHGKRWKWDDAAHRAARVEARATLEDMEALQREFGLTPYREQMGQRREEREQSADPRDLDFRLQRLGVPGVAIAALRNLRDTPALDSARKYVDAPGEWVNFLGLLGDTGLGKTVAAAYVFREVARRTSPDRMTGEGEPLVWVQASAFTRISAFSSDDTAMLERCRKARLVVLDDLGDEATALGAATVKDLCMARESAGRRTVLTSNLRPDKFQARYGAALWDRLQARGLVPRLEGKSMRRRE